MPSRTVRFDNTVYLNRIGVETTSFNGIIGFEIFQGLLEMSSWSTAINVLGVPHLPSFRVCVFFVLPEFLQFYWIIPFLVSNITMY